MVPTLLRLRQAAVFSHDHGHGHSSLRTIRSLSSSPENRPPDQQILASDNDDLAAAAAAAATVAAAVCEAVRRRPRWETTLLSEFPPSHLFHPSCINLVLGSLSSNPLLSLRYYLFLSSSSHPPPPSAATIILKSLAYARAWKSGLLAIRSTKCPIEPTVLNSFFLCLFDDADDKETIRGALDCLSGLPGFSHSLRTWNGALSGSLRSGCTDLVWQAYQLMISFGVVGDATTAGYLVEALCREGRLAEAYSLLREAAKNRMMPEAVFLTKLLAGFCKERDYGKVSELLHLMIAVGRPPGIYAYQTIIRGLCDSGMGEEGFRIFNELKIRGYAPDVVTYTTMIDGLCKMGRIDGALKLWSEMVGKGMEPNEYTYNSVIDGYCKAGNLQQAQKVYDEMLSRGYRESTVSCNTMIAGLCLQGLMGKAMEMFNEMPKKGINHDVITYNTLIQGFCKEQKTVAAMDLYRNLLETGLQPTVSTFTPLIQALCEEGNVVQATEMMKSMEAKGLEPLVCSNDSIITGFCKVDKFEEGMAWLSKVLENNLKPHVDTFNRLIKCLGSVGRVDDALLVVNAMLKIGYSIGTSASYILVEQLCQGASHQVQDSLNKMLMRN